MNLLHCAAGEDVPPADESAAAGLYVPEKRDVAAKQRRDAMIKAALAKEGAAKKTKGALTNRPHTSGQDIDIRDSNG